jgi:membrane protein
MSDRESSSSSDAVVPLPRYGQRLADFFDAGPARRGVYSIAMGMRRHNAARIASAMAFNLFLAAIPMLALAGWLAGHLLGRNQEALGITSLYVNLTPLQLHDILEKNFQRFSVGAVAPLALVGALWLASSAFHMLMSVFEIAVRARRRPWWKKRLIAIGCVLALNVLLAATAWTTVSLAGGPAVVFRLFRSGESLIGPAQRSLAIGIALVAATVALAGFFRIAVDRPGLNRRVWPGAVVTVAIGGLASTGFGIYARTLASFAVFYGSLAAVAVLLAWLWIWCAALLLGTELNAQLEGGERVAPPSTVRLRQRAALKLRAETLGD